MILKGSQRGGARQLALHLLNDRDNDHVVVQELRGFMAGDLYGALVETQAIAKGTRCRQPVFSLSMSPPKDEAVNLEALYAAADRAEEALGLSGQPRAMVVHEKNGRRHAHVVWSRIDAEQMKAINLPHFKIRLSNLSKDLYLEHGWELPEGHRTNQWKNPLNFTLAEWQQAKRLDMDPREIKMVFRDAWAQSDNLASFRHALEERGFFLAKGDKRGFVALDIHGEAFAVARWAGVKTKDVTAKLGDAVRLPGVEAVRLDTRKRMSKQLRGYLAKDRAQKQQDMKPLKDAQARMVKGHRMERARLDEGQKKRFEAESTIRAARFRRGLGAVMDVLTGRHFKTRRENEQEAFEGLKRDRAQRETLFAAQMRERVILQKGIDDRAARLRFERMRLARHLVSMLRVSGQGASRQQSRNAKRDFGMEI
ncbi:MAG: relaxase/mobilization nuclease domain-containing protein [Xanthobacteraceae bacterium]|nr:relaxase/mobilization nuclease domain-containing protein [Xanthobacteraceae bacterium]